MTVDFEGHAGRDCGEHRTVGGRAWCHNCSEWCYPDMPCRGCEIPPLRARNAELEAENADLRDRLPGQVRAVGLPGDHTRRLHLNRIAELEAKCAELQEAYDSTDYYQDFCAAKKRIAVLENALRVESKAYKGAAARATELEALLGEKTRRVAELETAIRQWEIISVALRENPS